MARTMTSKTVAPRTMSKWNRAEDQMVLDKYLTTDTKELASQLGRTPKSVAMRYYILVRRLKSTRAVKNAPNRKSYRSTVLTKPKVSTIGEKTVIKNEGKDEEVIITFGKVLVVIRNID